MIPRNAEPISIFRGELKRKVTAVQEFDSRKQRKIPPSVQETSTKYSEVRSSMQAIFDVVFSFQKVGQEAVAEAMDFLL